MAAVRSLGLFRICRGSGLFQSLASRKTSCKNVESCLNLVKQTSQKLSTCSILKSEEGNDETVKEPSTWFSNLLGYTQSEEETKVVDPEETKEREALFAEIADMYFAKPRKYPDIKFVERVVDCLIKYNDYQGVDNVWMMIQDMNLEPPEELIVKMENYLAKAREELWFK